MLLPISYDTCSQSRFAVIPHDLFLKSECWPVSKLVQLLLFIFTVTSKFCANCGIVIADISWFPNENQETFLGIELVLKIEKVFQVICENLTFNRENFSSF